MKIDKSAMGKLAAMGAAGIVGALGVKQLGRFVIDKVHDSFMKVLISDIYDENIWELVSSTVRIGPQVVLENSLRADDGKLVERPMGSPMQFPGLEDLKLNFAQLYTMPTEVETEIDFSTTIGKYARKPLELNHYMMIAPMAYGLALSKNVKIALAKGAASQDAAYNVGAGVMLPEERDISKHLIYQYNRGDWGKEPEVLKQCDAIEIQLGQGAYGGAGYLFKSQLMDAQLRKDFNKKKGENLVTHARQPEVQNPEDLIKLVDKLRSITGGVPIGVKIAAGKYLEMDLYWICTSGVDFIVIDGAEAATKGSPPILQDDFGVPTAFAINRAATFMEKHGFKNRISLIAAGRIRTPGDALKVRALGADACYIGAAALLAVSHPQILKALPFEPPTSVAFYGEAFADKFDINQGAKALSNFLLSCKLEMGEGIKALGKTSINQVCKDDLMTTNEMFAKGIGIPMVYTPFDPVVQTPPKVKRVKL